MYILGLGLWAMAVLIKFLNHASVSFDRRKFQNNINIIERNVVW